MFRHDTESLAGVPLVHLVLETLLVLLIVVIWQIRRRSPREERLNLTPEQEEILIREWQPEPLVPADFVIPEPKALTVSGKLGQFVTIDGRIRLNLATTNFLNFVGDPKIEEGAFECIKKYAVGTCGPRGFYGTTDVHIALEDALAHFCGAERAIVYSYGFSTFSSAICSYAKRHDFIVADEGVCLAMRVGIMASRSRVFWFRHNDINDLETQLRDVDTLCRNEPGTLKNARRFIVIEGLCPNYGDFIDLNKVVALKYRYKARIMIDESLSMGVLGATGRGLTEHFGIKISHIDLISFSLENAFASVGGACVGSAFMIDHQRLSGLGYCFSASSPTFLCRVVLDELQIISTDSSRIERLQDTSALFWREISVRLHKDLKVAGGPMSPIFHIRFREDPLDEQDYRFQCNVFDKIHAECLEQDVLVLRPSFLRDKELVCPPPSIRVALNCALTREALIRSVKVICEAIKGELGKF